MSQGTPEDFIRQIEDYARQMAEQGQLDELKAPLQKFLVPEPPELRRPAFSTPRLFRVRIDLDDAKPPIWRRLDLRSDLSLYEVHRAIQHAFFWIDYHLHRFALGGSAFDPEAQFFLCDFDVEEGDEGVPEGEVELSETLQQPGDRLRYTYDYGDSWDLTIKLEKVLDLTPETPWALCVGGRRAAPPEDSRGLSDSEVEEIIGDLEAFDTDEINSILEDADPAHAPSPAPERVQKLMDRVFDPQIHLRVSSKVGAIHEEPAPQLTSEEKAQALTAFQWFLDKADRGELKLTSAGYLKPALVPSAADVVPSARHWIGKKNREDQTMPVLRFRRALQAMRLLRKYKGELKLTKKGKAALQSPERLWEVLAAEIVIAPVGNFEHDLAVLELLEIATAAGSRMDVSFITAVINAAGWSIEGKREVRREDLWHFSKRPSQILREVGQKEEADNPMKNHKFSPAAVALAREALLYS